MKRKHSQLFGIAMLCRDFSFSFGAQAALIALDLIANGIKLILAYVYFYLFDHIETFSFTMVAWVGLFTLLAIIVSQGAVLAFSILQEQCVQKRLLRAQRDLFAAHSETQLSSLERSKSGKWLSLLGTDAQICAGFFGNTLVPLIRGVLLFVGALLMGAFISPGMTLVVLVCSMASGILMKYFQNKIYDAYVLQSEGEDAVQNSLLRCVQSMETVKAYQYESNSAQCFSKVYGNFAQKAIAAAKNANLLVSASIGSGFTISTLWMVIGIYYIFKGSMTVGAFSAFMMLSDYFNWPFLSVPKIYADAVGAVVSHGRLREFQTMKRETYAESRCDRKAVRLEVSNVTFAYGDAASVLEGFSCCIEQGQKAALTGESGTGKSTLLQLIMGLYCPKDGSVSVLYENKCFQGKSIQSLISYAPQVSDLFHATIAENIRLGNPEASEEEIQKAAKLACAHDFIIKLPQGYETVMGKGGQVKLSGGQAQRIALARALVKKAPIYVLDEITSALDDETESRVMRNLLALPQMVIFVAHKQTVIDACDIVIPLMK